MSFSHSAGSQAGWALIAGGVNAARVDAHRLHQYVTKILKIVETSPEKEHLYRMAGDLIVATAGRNRQSGSTNMIRVIDVGP